MSNAVFPDLPGIDIKVKKSPTWSTRIQKAVSGKELRADLYSYPLYKIALSYNVLRAGAEAELQNIIGFFNSRKGSFDSFLFTDPLDSTMTNQQIGIGDGTTKDFQIIRTLGGHVEPVMNLNGNPTIKLGGVAKTLGADFTVSSTGMVSFVAAPGNGVVVTCTANYYYRVRFDSDATDFEQFLWLLWQAKRVDLYGSLGTKI